MNVKSALFALATVAALSGQAAFAGDMNDFDVNRTVTPSTATREAVVAELKAAQAQGLVRAGDVVVAPVANLESTRSKAEVRAEARTALRAQRGHAVPTTDINS